MPPNFCHTRLRDPETQIRLLKLDHFDHNGRLHLHLTQWALEITPAYNAISYTWGDPASSLEILINGASFVVRKKCYEALEQAFAYDREVYIWIDSICIDQNDIEERNAQVQRMHSIYQNARQVLSCIGEHEHHSEWLYKVCELMTTLDTWTLARSQRWNSTVVGELVEEMSRALGLTQVEFSSKLLNILSKFGRRSYWRRLWIVQEISAGADAVLVLCGNSYIPLHLLGDISIVARTLSGPAAAFPMSQCTRIAYFCSTRTQHLLPLLESLHSANCADPRDRIFGLRAMVNWEDTGMEPIPVDYSRSAWSLAIELAPYFAVDPYGYLLRSLQINLRTSEMRDLYKQRTCSKTITNRGGKLHHVVFHRTLAIVLCAGEHGELCTVLQTPDLKPIGEVEDLKSPDRGPSYMPLSLYSNNRTIGRVCPETLPGDFLIFSQENHIDAICLIIRPRQDYKADIIGLAYVTKSFSTLLIEKRRKGFDIPFMQDYNVPTTEIFRAALHLSATSEDLIMWSSYRILMNEGLLEQHEHLRKRFRIFDIPEAAARLAPPLVGAAQHVEFDGSGRMSSIWEKPAVGGWL